MKHSIILIFSILVLTSCFDKESQKKIKSFDETGKYELIKIDSYGFRRAYQGHDTMSVDKLDIFMNRNPEPNQDYANSANHVFYKQLMQIGLIVDGNLNIKELDTLPRQFNYQISRNKFVKLRLRLLEEPSKEKASYELSFIEKGKPLLVDTLEFEWPPDVTFIKADVDEDGTEELLSIYRWYAINGDNFDLSIYKLNKIESDTHNHFMK